MAIVLLPGAALGDTGGRSMCGTQNVTMYVYWGAGENATDDLRSAYLDLADQGSNDDRKAGI
jgi:hypothetical protein